MRCYLKEIRLIKGLYKSKRITLQEYRTYKGQILSGNAEGALKGLQRKGHIKKKEAIDDKKIKH